MQIKINRLTTLNFKGLRSLDIEFNSITNIFGENATGKSSIFDAVLWLLFGKDSTDRTTFQIKPVDSAGTVCDRMRDEHVEVTGYLTIDDQDVELRRTYSENWVTKRGESVKTFAGHVQSFSWNNVPMKESEYQAKISGLLNETVFKLITSVAYFNVTLKWQQRRDVLLAIAGKIEDMDILRQITTDQNALAITSIINALNAKKTIEDYKKELAAKMLKIKNSRDLMPTRIDEATRNLPAEKDYDAIAIEIEELQRDLESIDTILADKTIAQEERTQAITALLTQKAAHQNRKTEIEFEIKNSFKDKKQARESSILDLKRETKSKEDEVIRERSTYNSLKIHKDAIVAKQNTLRADWAKINDQVIEFDESKFECPSCRRPLEGVDIDAQKLELTKNFNADKAERLAAITGNGRSLAVELEDIDKSIAQIAESGKTIRTELDVLNARVAELEAAAKSAAADESLAVTREIANNAEYIALSKAIVDIDFQISNKPVEESNAGLISRKKELTDKIGDLKKSLGDKEHREKTLRRIEELNIEEQDMSRELAHLQGISIALDKFARAKMDALESMINNRFRLVKFKLFNIQVNGGEDPCCETLIDGVPYADANTASKINAGLDIINVLCDHYDAYAPVFIDNAESINNLIPIDSQLIRLVVSHDKKLRIESSPDNMPIDMNQARKLGVTA